MAWAGYLGPVAGDGLAGHFARQVVERRDGVVVGARDDDSLADRVGLRKVVLLLPFGRNRHLVGHHIEAVGLERGEDRMPWCLNEFHVDADLLGDRTGYVDVIPGQLPAGRVVVAERCVHALSANPRHPAA